MNNRINDYFNETLISILNWLPGRWIVTEYSLVHHGWIAKIQNLDNFPIKDPIKFFLHSEEGFIEVSESDRVDSPKYGQSADDNEIINIIKAQIKDKNK